MNYNNQFSVLDHLESSSSSSSSDIHSIHSVQIDALVALKIIKHSKDSSHVPVTGALLGMDIDDMLQVTHCYPFLAKPRRQDIVDNQDDHAELDENYQAQMLKCLRQVNADVNTVGWYHCSPISHFLHLHWVAIQSDFQNTINNSIVLEYDPVASQTGALTLRAFRLTDAFMKLYKGKSRSSINSDAVTRSGLLDDGLLEEYKVQIRNSHLVSALLYAHNLTAHNVAAPMPGIDRAAYTAKHANAMLDSLDNYASEQTRYSGWNRAYQRDKLKMDQSIARKSDNGEDVHALTLQLYAKLPNEPPKLDSILLGHQIAQHTLAIDGFITPAVLSVELAEVALANSDPVN